ncbi:MAG: hypothetical protein WAO91_08870 [Candidatus Nitrosotenuis sp.]
MPYCPNCGKQNTSLLKDPNGKLYQLEDDLNLHSYDPAIRAMGKNPITYTVFVCGDCGNLFALGETEATQAS